MEKLVMRKCCCMCGWSVHICAIVNALISIIFSLLVITSCMLELIMSGQRYNSFFASMMKYEKKDDSVDKQVLQLSRQFSYVFLFNGLFSLVIGICNAYGILMRRKEFVLPWLVYNGTSLVGLTFATVIFAIIFPLGLFMLLILPLYAYMYLVGHSFYFRLAAAEFRAAARELEAASQKK